MRLVEDDDERAGLARRLREQAERDAAALVPRPGYPIFGLASPALEPVTIPQYDVEDDTWLRIKLGYGDPSSGPYVTVTTSVTHVLQGELGVELGEAADLPEVRDGVLQRDDEVIDLGHEQLPAGQAFVLRHRVSWAARLQSQLETVRVTIAGRHVDPADVRLEEVKDLRPVIEARLLAILSRLENPPSSS